MIHIHRVWLTGGIVRDNPDFVILSSLCLLRYNHYPAEKKPKIKDYQSEL